MATEAETLDELFQLAQKGVLAPQVTQVSGGEASSRRPCNVLIVPTIDGRRQSVSVVSVKKLLDEYADHPDRRSGTATVTTLVSMVDLVNRHKGTNSALFASDGRSGSGRDELPKPRLVAVIDYHHQGPPSSEEEAEPGLPQFCQHRVGYAFPLSDEWKAWAEQDGKPMAQIEFARFIEDHLLDVVPPDAAGDTANLMAQALGVTYATHARLLELSRGLEISVDHKLAQIVNLQTGEARVTFTEEHTDAHGAPITIPGAFILGIPVFRGATDRYQIPVRLRYRKQGGSLTWWFELYRADAAFDIAFRDACELVRAGTLLPLYFGTPEV